MARLRGVFLLPALLLSICLGGCTHYTLSQDDHFDPATTPDSSDALVLVGMRATRLPVRHSFLTGDYRSHAALSMLFQRLTPDNLVDRPARSVSLCNMSASNLGAMLSQCDITEMQYRLFRAPPGRYALTAFFNHMNRLIRETNFVDHGHPGERLGLDVAQRGDPDPVPALSFSVNAGQITYIGDFNWDPASPARLLMTRNDTAAQTALLGYPNVTAPIVFQAVTLSPSLYRQGFAFPMLP